MNAFQFVIRYSFGKTFYTKFGKVWKSTMPLHPSRAPYFPRKPVVDKKKVDKEDVDNNKRFNVRAMCYETYTKVDNSTDEWILHGLDTTRTNDLSKVDIEELKARNLGHLVEQARHMKPLWALKYSRSQLFVELQKRNLIRGYSQGNIGKICSALSFANKENEDAEDAVM